MDVSSGSVTMGACCGSTDTKDDSTDAPESNVLVGQIAILDGTKILHDPTKIHHGSNTNFLVMLTTYRY